MEEGAILLIGKKDFGGFQNSGAEKSSTIREIESISIEGESFYHFTLIGNSFLYKMVRNIVGTLVYIGSGKLAISDKEMIHVGVEVEKNTNIVTTPKKTL
jgi:tRNA pseudouridine38-40 synthase